MKEPNPPIEGHLSRRELLKRVTVVGVGTAASASLSSTESAVAATPQPEALATQQPPPLRALEALTAHEFETVTAITGRLIPSDETGPGAIEANASTYIDRALNSHHRDEKDGYSASLTALDAYSKATHGAEFTALPAAQQDAVLTALEKNGVNQSFGFRPDARAFFNTVLRHTREGMFGDRYYGGNTNFIGWDLLGFAGIKLLYTPAEQQLDYPIVKAHRSVYSYDLFKGRKQ